MRAITVKIVFAITCLCCLMLGGCKDLDANTEMRATANSLGHIPTEMPASFGTTFLLPSKIYQMEREINVYVPQIPDWGKGYFEEPLSILYLIDGGLEQDFFHIAALSNLTLINAERQPMIVVGVRTHNRRAEITPRAIDERYKGDEFEGWGGSHMFRRHLTEEVKPFIQSRFETDRQAIIGESLAGLFIIELFLEEPNTFDDYISISPSLWWDDRRLSKQAPALLQKHETSDRRLYLTMADEGGTMRQGLEEFMEALDPLKNTVNVKFVDRASNDTHRSIYHHAARDALTWLYGIPTQTYGEIPWYLTLDENPTPPK